ncbi:hypothetical protein QS933_26535, partial [Escherichia coli]|nr:hypothetical protein [Escherichia coli]
QNDVTLKMPAFEWVHVQLHQQKGMISLSPPTICNSALLGAVSAAAIGVHNLATWNPDYEIGKNYVKRTISVRYKK